MHLITNGIKRRAGDGTRGRLRRRSLSPPALKYTELRIRPLSGGSTQPYIPAVIVATASVGNAFDQAKIARVFKYMSREMCLRGSTYRAHSKELGRMLHGLREARGTALRPSSANLEGLNPWISHQTCRERAGIDQRRRLGRAKPTRDRDRAGQPRSRGRTARGIVLGELFFDPSSFDQAGAPIHIIRSSCRQANVIAASISPWRSRYAPRCRFPFKIRRSRCGVTGSCVMAPGNPMASSMADAIAAPTPVMPLSPAPLMPSGLSGLL